MNISFDPRKSYTLEEIEIMFSCKPTHDRINKIYSVIDLDGDFSQYDFIGEPNQLRLNAIDGELIQGDVYPGDKP